MTSPKIIPDTNVIVAASILFKIGELGTTVKHHFYDQSIQLFSIIKKGYNKKIGYLVPQVKTEVRDVLSEAVHSTFDNEGKKDPRKKDVFFKNKSGFVFTADQNMRHLLGFLFEEELDQMEVDKNQRKVEKMYRYLKEQWDEKYSNNTWKNSEAKYRAKPMATHWKSKIKMEVISLFKTQVEREAEQLGRFARKYPNRKDGLILAQVSALKRKLDPKGTKYDFIIASCDTGAFSPHTGKNGVSDIVTREIQERLGIYCNHPKNVFKMAGGR